MSVILIAIIQTKASLIYIYIVNWKEKIIPIILFLTLKAYLAEFGVCHTCLLVCVWDIYMGVWPSGYNICFPWDPGFNLTLVDLSGRCFLDNISLGRWSNHAAPLRRAGKLHHKLTQALWVKLGEWNYLETIHVCVCHKLQVMFKGLSILTLLNK